MRPYELSLAAAAAEIRERRLSPVELVDSVLGRIDRVEPHLGAYVAVTAEQARDAAREAEREIAGGRYRGPLHGVPVGLKDLIDVAGTPTTASSRVRDGHRAAEDSTVAARLRAAGAATFALGTDTGGSIRVPAALNGVVGLKPTYGLVPRYGVTSLSWSLDHVGPITRTVEDAALVLAAIAGYDPRDPASVTAPAVDYRPEREPDLTGVRVGVPDGYYLDHVDEEVAAAVHRAVAHLEALGARPVAVEIPMARYLVPALWGLTAPEAAAYHARTLRTVPELYQADVRVLLEAGELIGAGDYLRAQRARTMIREAWARVLAQVEVIAAPTVPTTAVRAGQESVSWPDGTTESVPEAYVRLSAPANVTGVPALSVPAGHDGAGLPIGLQLLGRPFGERTLLRVGHAYERTRPARALAPVV
ncbi:amidase [Kitasatospora sp. NPDC096204]|uniref:amidase n=1 Tax=Kitasatospora sp. NPDC096204 TaxID=3364094 RepID=UPI00382B3F83